MRLMPTKSSVRRKEHNVERYDIRKIELSGRTQCKGPLDCANKIDRRTDHFKECLRSKAQLMSAIVQA